MSTSIIASVKAKLQNLTEDEKGKNKWKPPLNEEVSIRILPYKHGSDPFNELYFHYDLGEDPGYALCPKMTLGGDNKCPICEFAQATISQKTDDQKKQDENYTIFKKFKAKLRTYIPIIIRGKESEGVKFWGISKTSYVSIMQFWVDPDYGDMSNPLSGRDLKVKALPKSKEHIYGSVSIRPAANQSKLSDDGEFAVSLIKTVPEVSSVFKLYTYNELKSILEKLLSFDTKTESTITESTITEESELDNDSVNDVDKMLLELSNSSVSKDISKE